MRGKLIVQKNLANSGWYTTFHGESGQLYYAELVPIQELTMECHVFYCNTEGNNNSNIEWDRRIYCKQVTLPMPMAFQKCIEEFLGYPVDMEIIC